MRRRRMAIPGSGAGLAVAARHGTVPPTTVATLTCLVALVLSVTGCSRVASAAGRPTRPRRTSSAAPTPGTPPSPAPSVMAAPSPSPTPTAHPCQVIARHFPCVMQKRIRAVKRYLATQPGVIGVVLHDRETGGTWQNGNADTELPAASTIKLAVVADLMLRERAGQIQLSAYDWSLIHNALHESSDVAADQLWFAFENGSFLQRIQAFGMQGAEFTSAQPYWGYMYCTPEDLSNLMNYVLDNMPRHDRDYLISQLRHVAPIQRWGVWGAGRANHPGNKDGWEDDKGVWIVNTVGFAGPHEKYTLAIMDDLGGSANFSAGANTLTQVASLFFRGRYGPEPTAEATAP